LLYFTRSTNSSLQLPQYPKPNKELTHHFNWDSAAEAIWLAREVAKTALAAQVFESIHFAYLVNPQ